MDPWGSVLCYSLPIFNTNTDLLNLPRSFQLLCSCPLERAVCWHEVKHSCVYIQKQTQNLFILTGWYLITVCLLLIPLPRGIVDLHRFWGFYVKCNEMCYIKKWLLLLPLFATKYNSPVLYLILMMNWKSTTGWEVCERERLGVDLGVEFPQENPLPTGTLWYCGRPFKKLPRGLLGIQQF